MRGKPGGRRGRCGLGGRVCLGHWTEVGDGADGWACSVSETERERRRAAGAREQAGCLLGLGSAQKEEKGKETRRACAAGFGCWTGLHCAGLREREQAAGGSRPTGPNTRQREKGGFYSFSFLFFKHFESFSNEFEFPFELEQNPKQLNTKYAPA